MRSLRSRGAVTGTTALLTTLALSGTALAFTPPNGARDVREFACSPADIPDRGFTDVLAGDVFKLETSCLAAYGITTGKTDTTYAPAEGVTRVQMALFLVRLVEEGLEVDLGQPDPEQGEFDDVTGKSAEARRAIELLFEIGVTNGVNEDNTLFAPDRVVTRGQMAAFIDRTQDFLALDLDGGDTPFPVFFTQNDFFPDDTGGTFESETNNIASEGIAGGFADGSYRAGAPVSRGQMAAFLSRLLDIDTEADPSVGSVRDNEVFSDGITQSRPATGPALGDRGEGSDVPLDDREYTVADLRPGVEYRVTLVETSAFERRTDDADGDGDSADEGEDRVVFFDAANGAGTAAPGDTPAVITVLAGEDVAEPTKTGVAVADEDGVLEFTVDSDEPTEFAPFVYPTTPPTYTSFDTFLEVAEDLRPVELFGVGPVSTYSESPLR